MQVEVFSDVVCPWCYIGKRRLEEALDTFPHADDVTVTYRSFQLDPSTPKNAEGSPTERIAAKYGVSLEQAEAMNQRVRDVAAADGLDFHLDNAHAANTFDAHRLLHFAAERGGPGSQAALKERLLAAYFTRGENIDDTETLVTLAGEVGLDMDQAQAALAGDDYGDAVRGDLALARAFGVSSVPFFVIDRKYGIAGAQESTVLEQALENAWMEAHPLTMVNTGDPASTDASAGSCTDEACAI